MSGLGKRVSIWFAGNDKAKIEEIKPVEILRFEPLSDVAKHKEKIDAVRKAAAVPEDNKIITDVVIYRYLKGYDFAVDAAAEAVTKLLTWRKENKVDEIRAKIAGMKQADFPHGEKISKLYPQNIDHGLDKKGQPLALFKIGAIDPAAVCTQLTIEELVEYHIYCMEFRAQLVDRLTEETKTVVRITNVMDLTGLSLRHLNRAFLRYFRAISDVSQDYYAELVGNIYIVNPPWAFAMLWKVAKPVIKPYTLEKISVLGADYKKELLEAIPADNLPTDFGGSCSKCSPCVFVSDPDVGMTKVEILRRAKHEVPIAADSKTLVSWEFRTVGKNISFGVRFVPKGADGKEGEARWMREVEAVDSHKELQSGGVRATEEGIVYLVFDNTGSLLTGKSLFYRHDKVTEQVVDKARRSTLVFKYAPGQAPEEQQDEAGEKQSNVPGDAGVVGEPVAE